ncbi:MAG: GNAT family N-acetyltransferase [Candidatus Marinimicrobia bacterium]|nr:GNAT family N-acetyltransferase [Candidatus Neomarinimicrobiota bacterium]MDP6610962.1 GNAT family N-acetyltransferase [Candidatus Neomarinimicrobiota bacterium]
MDIHIVSGDLEEAFSVSQNIPEFDTPYDISEYEKRLDDSPLILTAELGDKPIGFKIGYDRFKDGSFYSWMGGILPEHRKNGVASALADYQEEWARLKEYKSIKLKTRNKHETMISFAIDREFNIIDSEPNEDIQEIRIWMEKVL